MQRYRFSWRSFSFNESGNDKQTLDCVIQALLTLFNKIFVCIIWIFNSHYARFKKKSSKCQQPKQFCYKNIECKDLIVKKPEDCPDDAILDQGSQIKRRELDVTYPSDEQLRFIWQNTEPFIL